MQTIAKIARENSKSITIFSYPLFFLTNNKIIPNINKKKKVDIKQKKKIEG